MKVPAGLSADRLIREYLARVAEAGMHYLPMGRRGAFVEGTRRRIEREIGPDGIGDAARVRDVLSRLGDPADLVRAESARLDAERTKRQPGNKVAGGADPDGATAPMPVRPINSRWRPGTRWQSSTGPAGPVGQDPRWFPWASADAGPRGSDRTVPLPSGRGTNQASGVQGTQTPGGIGTRALEGGGTLPPQREPANWVRPPTADASRAGSAAPSGGDTPAGGIPLPPREVYMVRGLITALGSGAARLAVDTARLARQYPLESAAVTLLAIGGLILPFPYWLFGGLLGGILAIRSRIWNARDKWVAIVGPAVVVLVGTVLAALIIGGRGHAVTAYPHAFHLYGGNLLRVGNALCAVYLALQARHGPQRRLPPWRR